MTNKEFLASVGMEVRIARTRRKMSITDLSKLTGLGKGAIGKLERGDTDGHILTYKRIADALKVELTTFLIQY